MKVTRTAAAVVAGVIALALTIPAVLILLPLWAVAALTASVRRRLERRTVSWREIVQYEPEVGWKPRPGLEVYAADHNGDAFRVTTDADGWRGGGIRLHDAHVIVLGDSFAFGDGVDDGHFFANLDRDLRVKAIGCPAYSMVQPLLWLERLAPTLRGKSVLWWIYLGNDLSESLQPHFNEYRAPFVRSIEETGGWEVASDHVRREKWPFPTRPVGTEAYIETCSPSHFSQRVFSACEYLLAQGRQICEAAHARLVVMTIPELSGVARAAVARTLAKIGPVRAALFDEDLPDRTFAEICARQRLEFIPLRGHLTAADYRRDDYHWNERGHRRVARMLRDVYRAQTRDEVKARLERRHVSSATLSTVRSPAT